VQESAFYHDVALRCPPVLRELVHRLKADVVRVRDVMSPVVLKVSASDPVMTVVAEFLALKIHRLFVVDDAAKLVGVISALDVMRHLKRQTEA
jgi:CBS-domain-containing membrane protein